MPLSQIPLLQADNLAFPDIATAQRERDGLVAVGGDLSTARMLAAYRQGIGMTNTIRLSGGHLPSAWCCIPQA